MVAGEAAVDRLISVGRRVAGVQADFLGLVYEVAGAAPVEEFAAVEVACALTYSRFAAEDVVRLAGHIVERLPAVHAALSNGDIDLPKARVFADVLAEIDVSIARDIAAAVLPKAPSRTTGQLRDMLRRKAIATDPAFAARRRERAAARRGVQVHAADDGTASLAAFGLDAARAAAAMQRIGAIARARRFAGQPEKVEQIRADVLLELLEGKHQDAPGGVVQVTVSLDTLARFNDDPASFGGFGAVAADIARQWLQAHPGYQWQYSIHDPATGVLLQQGLTRHRPGDTTAPGSTRTSPTRPGNATGSPRPRPGNGDSRNRPQPGPVGNRRMATRAAPRRPAASRGDAPEDARQASSHGTSANRGDAAKARSADTATHNAKTCCGSSDAAAKAAKLARPPVQNPRDRLANAAMTRWIRMRDKTCRAPGCRMPAARCDTDHTTRYIDGGTTTHCNLCALCRFHHRVKEEGGWTVIHLAPGYLRWISPLGHIYDVGPEPPP